MTKVTVFDGAHKRLQKLNSFDASLNSQNANLNSTKRKLDFFFMLKLLRLLPVRKKTL